MTTAEWNRNIDQDAGGYESLAAAALERANATADKKDKTQTVQWRETADYYRKVARKIRELAMFDLTALDEVYQEVRV